AGGVCTALGLNNGVVPWRTLGLVQNDVIDAWGALVTYKVWGVTATALTANDGLDMSGLNPTVSPVVLNWLSVRGFRLCRATPCAPGSASELASKATGNGIAYFLISHGPNKVGAYLPGGTFSGAASGAGPGPLENINRNNLALRTISPNDFYVDALFDENPASYYDDLVLHPSIIKVASDAGLQPKNP
ncbi:MAG: hypothetical protein RLZZ612_2394, partial [Pseudomonadota bacterium]